jgi:hypothetical protein
LLHLQPRGAKSIQLWNPHLACTFWSDAFDQVLWHGSFFLACRGPAARLPATPAIGAAKEHI